MNLGHLSRSVPIKTLNVLRWHGFFRTSQQSGRITKPTTTIRNNLCVCHARLASTSTNPSSLSDVQNQDKNKFNLFYRSNYIIPARLLARMKLYQTGICVTALPPMVYLSSVGSLPWSATYTTLAVATFAAVVLYAMSYYLRRLIGLMSLDSSKKIVKVAHLTFWGNRKDLYLKVEDVVPLSELPDDVSKEVLIKFRLYNQDKFLFFSLKYGTILNRADFEHVFGKIDIR